MEKLPKLASLPSACVKNVSVNSFIDNGEQIYFRLTIHGKTLFMHPIANTGYIIEYKKDLPFCFLHQLNKGLKEELKEKIMPEFPGTAFFKSGQALAPSRVIQLDKYFSQLFKDYSQILLQSSVLINSFEPQRIDLNVIGKTGDDATDFIKTLANLVGALEITKADKQGIAEIGFKEDTKQILDRVRGESNWERVMPFDYKYNSKVYRIDGHDIGNSETTYDKRENVFKLYKTSYTFCIFVFKTNKLDSYISLKDFLENVRLLKLNDKNSVPPFIVIGVKSEQDESKVSTAQVEHSLAELFINIEPCKYIEVSYADGHGIMEALNASIDTMITANNAQLLKN